VARGAPFPRGLTAVPRLYVDPARFGDDRIDVAGEDVRYLARVLRLRPGDELVLFDGAGHEARGRIARLDRRQAQIEIQERLAAPPPLPARTLILAMPRADKVDLVVQKATELGVARIMLAQAERSAPGGEAAAPGRVRRWEKIAREAARQSGRADVPLLAPLQPLERALEGAPASAARLLFWEEARGVRLRAELRAEDLAGEVVVAVGPEGGFSRHEVDVARAIGYRVCGLGPLTLRAETAALAALVLVGACAGELG
jgi:16S rRNA (uracil1498-N3)-methyltransferase